MDENMVISSSSSYSLMSQPLQEFPPCSLHQRLQFLLQSQPQWWNYTIFWRASTHIDHVSLSLVWGEGHFQGFKSPSSEPISRPFQRPKKKPHFLNHDDLKAKEEAGSSMDDVEWFYMTSPPQSYRVGGNGILPKCFITGSLVWLTGSASLGFYNCHRVKEAQAHGLQTLVCIPVSNGVLELGSLDLIKEYWALVLQAHSLFGPSNHLKLGQDGPDFVLQGLSFCDMSPNYTDPLEQYDSDGPVSHVAAKKRGKRRSEGPTVGVNNVEAERLRREKMNRRFYDLRSVVPTVSKMDKASLLADAVAYINQLKAKIINLESQVNEIMLNTNTTPSAVSDNQSTTTALNSVDYSGKVISSNNRIPDEVEVKVMGNQVLIRVQTQNINHPSARLMSALKDLELQVNNASVSTMEDLMLQDVVILKVPEELNHDGIIKDAILKRLDL